jgi:hypothetical protein
MSVPKNFLNLIGDWTGSNHLYLSQNDPVKISTSLAKVGVEIKNKILKVNYDWVFEGEKQEGLLLFNFNKKNSDVSSIWVDSWHQTAFMNCKGLFEDNKISVRGFYTMPEYSDWSWRTDLEVINENAFSFTMFNIAPDGKEDIAVEAKFNERI